MSGRCKGTNLESDSLSAAALQVYRRSSCHIWMPAILLLGPDGAYNVAGGNRNKYYPQTLPRKDIAGIIK